MAEEDKRQTEEQSTPEVAASEEMEATTDVAEDKHAKPKKKPGRIRKTLGWAFKPFVNVTGWLGYRSLANNARSIKSRAREVFVPKEKTANEETFEQAKSRLGLSDEALQDRAKQLLFLVVFFVAIGALILVYAIYIAFAGSFTSFMLAFVVGALALAFAFRYHFWWFQIKHRKLGCSFREWLNSTTKEEQS